MLSGIFVLIAEGSEATVTVGGAQFARTILTNAVTKSR